MKSRGQRGLTTRFVAAVVGLASITVAACGDKIQDSSAVLDEIVAFNATAAPGDRIDVTDLTDFEWDLVYGFPDGTPKKEINETIGATMFGRRLFDPSGDTIAVPETAELLIFVRGEEVVHAVVTTPPDTLGLEPGRAYDAASAYVEKSEEGWLVLEDASGDT